MQFANPIWLWALSGLMIPVGIHLLSRKEGKVIYIGSLRHLDESSTKQFKAIRLNEVLLLIIRCVFIILTVLLLAGIQWKQAATKERKWLVIEPGLQHDKTIASLTDSLTKADYETHYLAPGFPTVEDTTHSDKNYWALIHEFKSSQVQEVIVLSRSYLKDFTGDRSVLPSIVKWITVDTDPKQTPLTATRVASDSAIVRSAKSNAQQTSYEYSTTSIAPGEFVLSSQNDSIALNTTDTLRITLVYDPVFQFDATILDASLKSIAHIPAVVTKTIAKRTSNFQNTPTDWLIWLSEKSPPKSAACHMITFKNEPTAHNIVYREGPQTPYQRWTLSKRLNVDNALQQHLTAALANALLQNETLERAATEADKRNIPEAFLQASSENLSATKRVTVTQPLDKYVIVLIALLLLTERLVAYKRNQ
jgi:hypothetical protein